jgi:RNA polymerase sigma-70 factor (ECF subfamily)
VELARSAIPGDTRAFGLLVDRYKERVLANCRFLSGSALDAEDLAQEVFVKVYSALPRFESRSTFSTWVQRIKINHCLSYLRRERGRIFVDVDRPELETLPELQIVVSADGEAARLSRRDHVRVTLESMPDTLRIPLVLCDVDGLSYQEIADQLELGLSATKMRIKRAREHFRERYRDPETEHLPSAAAPAEPEDARRVGTS